MRLPGALTRLQPKLLLSYLLVIATGIGGVVLGVQIVAPSLFDRLLIEHMGGRSSMLHRGMTASLEEDTLDVFRTAITQSLIVGTFVATIAAIVVSLFVTRRITTPIARMAEASQRIAAGHYGERMIVTERDEIGDLAANLNDMAAALQDAESRRAQVIGDVAHEIRTPLATIRGYLEGLIDGVIQPDPTLLAQLHDETGRLQRLIDDLQELSRVESGQVSLDLKPHSLADLIGAALARLRPPFDEKGVSLRVNVPAALPLVLADADRTVQVVTNLVSNALRYTPPGGEVTIAAAERHDCLECIVHDTGIGIGPEHLPRIFDRFYRTDVARSRATGGSGVGLTIARALVEAQGGRIEVESPGPGQGSTFKFTLPLARS